MSTIDQLFDGVELSDEFKGKMKDIFEATIKQKLEECNMPSPVSEDEEELTEEHDGDVVYVISYVNTGIPVKIFYEFEKAIDFVAKRNEKQPNNKVEYTEMFVEAKNEVTDDLEEDEEMVVVQEAEGDNPEDLSVDTKPKKMTADDVKAMISGLTTDIDFKKVLIALKLNPMAFERSIGGAVDDVEGNRLANLSFMAIIDILLAIADDSTTASRVAQFLKKDKPVDEDMSVMVMDDEEDEENDIDLMGMDEELVESVNQYLTYVAESWVEENRLAVEQGLKTEIAESFMSGLKNLFTEHNINVPEETSIVSELQAKVKNLEESVKKTDLVQNKKLNEEIQKTLRFKKKLNEQISQNVFNTVSASLTLTQKEKFKKLVENVEFTDEQSYTEKLNQISDNLYNDKSKKKVTLSEETFRDESNKETASNNPIMEIYSKAITNHSKF